MLSKSVEMLESRETIPYLCSFKASFDLDALDLLYNRLGVKLHVALTHCSVLYALTLCKGPWMKAVSSILIPTLSAATTDSRSRVRD
jgi:hypothetical protein